MNIVLIALALLFWLVLIGGIVSAFILTFRTPGQYDYPLLPVAAQRFVWTLTLIAVIAVPVAAVNGNLDDIFSSVPDGCYRISSSSSVGFVSNGKGVSPVIISGKTYTPIACPNG